MKLEPIIINSLMIAGIHVLLWPGMIFAWMRKYLKHLPLFIRKPLFECMICMASIWGTAFFLYKNGLSLNLDLIPHLLAVCGCNLILDSCIHYWRREFITNSGTGSFEAPEAKGKLR